MVTPYACSSLSCNPEEVFPSMSYSLKNKDNDISLLQNILGTHSRIIVPPWMLEQWIPCNLGAFLLTLKRYGSCSTARIEYDHSLFNH